MAVRKVREGVYDIDIGLGSHDDRFRKRVKASCDLEAARMETRYRQGLGKPDTSPHTVSAIAEKYITHTTFQHLKKQVERAFR